MQQTQATSFVTDNHNLDMHWLNTVDQPLLNEAAGWSENAAMCAAAGISADGGTAEDALAVNGVNGNNVLNGSTGSGFLYGGSGNDTFFVDDPASTTNIWSTAKNLHSGDNATVWGITPNGFNLSWLDGQEATGFAGLTLTATPAGKTQTGLDSTDLTNGTLTINYGTTPNEPGLAGSNYILIQAI